MTKNERVAIEKKLVELDLEQGIVIKKGGIWYVCAAVDIPVDPPHINLSYSSTGPCIIDAQV